MTIDIDALLQQAAEALKDKQYATADALQRRGCELVREQQADKPRIANEIEKLADIHCESDPRNHSKEHNVKASEAPFGSLSFLKNVLGHILTFQILSSTY